MLNFKMINVVHIMKTSVDRSNCIIMFEVVNSAGYTATDRIGN